VVSRRLKLTDETRSVIRTLHPDLKRKIRSALSEILSEPKSGKALQEDLEGLWSIRVGRMRIIYRPSLRFLEVIAIGPRRDIYTETLRLLKRDQR
jgi:mRNA interferase RelE/StbE